MGCNGIKGQEVVIERRSGASQSRCRRPAATPPRGAFCSEGGRAGAGSPASPSCPQPVPGLHFLRPVAVSSQRKDGEGALSAVGTCAPRVAAAPAVRLPEPQFPHA